MAGARRKRVTKWERETARSQWLEVNRTLTHFNDIIHRTRQLTATVVLAAYGAALASFNARPELKVELASCIPPLHAASVIVFLGIIALAVGCAIDRGYYFRLLISAVELAERLETDFELPAKLTVKLTNTVSRIHATTVVISFYVTGLVIGVFLIWFLNTARVVT
jgi:hypothetical protein